MKATLLIPCALCIWITGNGQTAPDASTTTTGTIRFEEKAVLDIKLEGETAALSEMLPKERSEKKVLYFSPEATLYQSDEEVGKSGVTEQEVSGAMVQFQVYQPDDKLFRDLKTGRTLEQRDFMSRMFLIERSEKEGEWKLTRNQKSILGFPCQEAVREQDGRSIQAWFTPAIPVSSGPRSYGDLPGMILVVDINKGDRTLTAVSVDFKQDVTGKIVKPREGKKVTAEQFNKIRDEKLKEMGAEGGGDGQTVTIKIQR